MDWKQCKYLIASDLKREIGKERKMTVRSFIYNYLVKESFKTSLWLRLGNFFLTKSSCVYRPLYYFSKVLSKHVAHKTGIQIPIGTQVGEGLKFFHYGCIVIAQSTRIGNNVSIHQGVTIGRVFNGCHAGVPTIGDNVVIFAGSIILGNVTVGDNAVIGANAVVTKDVPSNAVVAGIPAKVISEDSRKCFDKNWGNVFSHYYYE